MWSSRTRPEYLARRWSSASKTVLEFELKNLIPAKINTFPKLTSDHAPYRFHEWSTGRNGVESLYYQFPKRNGTGMNRKRIPLPEIRAALEKLKASENLDGEGFRVACPIAEGDGHCGYCVIGRIFEALGVARLDSAASRFVLTDRERATKLLG